jgi:hypothetical protein
MPSRLHGMPSTDISAVALLLGLKSGHFGDLSKSLLSCLYRVLLKRSTFIHHFILHKLPVIVS